ncbi:related to monooxygenase [Phialocephala subalpina]|uniref:Related to monooxygenase n=1 Tax=Phialocephala subalpina TaxID=576137 RepID=A0A1L7XA26_9HELO|nr:related to monooxygenase [Phialocephala subalpina]
MIFDFDIVIVGAGLSGINAAQRVQTEFPGLTYTILEAREALGGTWDLFKYPGIRSDSDLYTFGFPWRLWESTQAIADGPSIKRYLVESAAESGIEKHIQYHHRLISADWSSKTQTWSLIVDADGEKRQLKAGFMIYGTGYYDYEEPLQTTIPNIDKFNGTIVHPQFWPQDLEYNGKKIVIIGSGATAVTLLPVLAKTAASVTMLQRSPTYILSAPAIDSETWIRRLFPSHIAHQLIRWKFMWGMWLYFQFCRLFPTKAKQLIKVATAKELPKHIAQDPHFKPAYNPWEQRLCVCPDGDFYEALRQGNSHVVTDTIETVTESGILTAGGTVLEADIIVTATGLKMKFAGGAQTRVDGTLIKFSDKYLWKGALLQDVPNTAFLLGYTNASWTLGAEASIQLVCRVLRYMMARRLAVVTPRVEDESKVQPRNMMNLKSTYIVAGRDVMPKGGDLGPWKARVNYFKDFWNAKFGGLEGLEFRGAW